MIRKVQRSRLLTLVPVNLIQGLAFTSGVAEVAFAGDTSFLRLSDGSAVATVAMNSIKAGENAEVGRIILGGAVTDGSAAGEGLLVPLGETENMIAVHPTNVCWLHNFKPDAYIKQPAANRSPSAGWDPKASRCD